MRTKLQEGESVIYIAKKHWIVYLIGLFLAISVIFLAGFIKQTLWGVVFGIIVMLYVHLERKFNIWIVTNKRFIDERGIVVFIQKKRLLIKSIISLFPKIFWVEYLAMVECSFSLQLSLDLQKQT